MRREPGFTMIEVIITAVILAIIVLSIAAFFSFELKSWVSGESKAYAVQKARLALNGDIHREVKNPGIIPELRRLRNILKAETSSIVFEKLVDDNPSDTALPDTHTITYSFEKPDPLDPTGHIQRVDQLDPSLGGTTINATIADNILGFSLTYLDIKGDTLPSPPTSLINIRQIKVEIEVDTNQDGKADFSLTSRAMLRNIPLKPSPVI
ncbi:MAG: prepilin-type N-terminal cleavage/methylation domain-containing protein [bacterium]